jgi:uncharacterized membrane protein YbhN (UPF0104 family)
LDTEISTNLRDVPSPTRRRVLAWRALRIAWFTVLALGLALALRSRWVEVRVQLASLQPTALWLSVAAALAGVGASSGIWHQMLAGIGETLPVRTSLRIFFVGQIGKYLPGAVWPAVTQAALAREHGVAPRATVSAVTLFLWVHVLTGTAVAVLLLVVSARLPAVALLALPAIGAVLTPRLLGWSLRTLLRLARRAPLRRLPDGRHLLAACGWALVMWLCYGVHLRLLTSAVAQPVDLILATGVFAAAWVVGFVMVIAPAGTGPREVVIVALLPLAATPAGVVALVSRLAVTVADGAWAALTAPEVLGRRSRVRRAHREGTSRDQGAAN